jgi:hypothetical protein
MRVDASANPHLIDVQVDGVACGQASRAVAASTYTGVSLGIQLGTPVTGDSFTDDFIITSQVSSSDIQQMLKTKTSKKNNE